MGLTLFTYLATLAMLVIGVRVKGRVRGGDIRSFRLAALASVAWAALHATGYLLAESDSALALTMIRWSAASSVFAYLAFFRLALTYPYGARIPLVDVLLLGAAAAAAWFIGNTDAYLFEIRRVRLEFIQFEGSGYDFLSFAAPAVGVAAFVALMVRAFLMKSRVYRQQAFVVAAGILASVAAGFVIQRYLVNLGLSVAYPLGPIGAVIAVGAAAWAFNATRLFHLPTAVGTAASYLLLFALFAAPLGLLVGVLLLFRLSMTLIVVAASVLGFVLVGRWADSFASTRFGAARNEEAREALEAGIAHLDLSAGRDSVLGELSSIMSAQFGCSWFSVMSETDAGGLANAYPAVEESEAEAPDAPVMEALAGLERRVVLKTDVVADPEYAKSKAVFLEFFDKVGAEAIILAKEGRRIIGVFAFGPKRSGADYDDLDYEAFQAIHGKLFVVAYYVRHVARESLLATVEKEIGLADQIVRAVQESIDPIVHPGVDVAFVCRSTRQLGGDLFDSVRISEHRWFFVVGDVSGKGLNASMSMIILKSMIRTLLREEKDFTKLVSRVNAFIKEHLPRGTFFAGAFGFIALDKGSIYFINCGIPVIYFRSPGLDTVIEVQGDGRMLGFVKNVEPFLKTRKLALPPGSSVVISTDGIVEAESVRGERYGKERLVRIVSENKGAAAQEMIDAIVKSATAFTDGKLDDDVTVVAIKYAGRKESQP